MTQSARRMIFLAALAVATPAFAQFRGRIRFPNQAGNIIVPDSPDTTKDTSAVYVRDSGVASEKLALANRMEKAAQWDKSADVYQEIVEKYSDRVVPTHTDPKGQPTQYTSVAMVVQEKIAKWPEAGLTAYRRRFDDVARDQLTAAADDPAALQRVMSLYFPTDAGKTAGIKLLAASLERGQFALASWIGRRLLTLHPSLTEERPAVLFQTALAEHLGGNDSAAQAHLADLKTNFPAALGTVRGTEVKLADSLATELAGQPTIAQSFRADSWPMAFGAPDADAVPPDVSKGGARLFSIELAPPPNGRAGLNRQYKTYLASTTTDRAVGGMTGILPAIDNGELFFQDNAHVYAISLASGLPLPGWLGTYPGDKRGQFSSEAFPTPRGQQLSVTVNPDSVFAVLGQVDQVAMATGVMNFAPQTPQVVSLDRQSGKRNWSAALDKLKLPDSAATLRDGTFYGTPVVIGDSLYVLVRATRGGQFDECHVVSLRVSDGSFQWSAYIASTSLGNNRFGGFGEDNSQITGATGQMSYSDGRLYVLTNMGAVACLDASDGKTLWLDIYARSPDQIGRISRGFLATASSTEKPFAINPPIIHGSQLFLMPRDSASILVYDAASGDLVTTVPRALDPKFEPADMMLAVVDQKLVLGNRGTIFTVPWSKFDPNQSLVANGGMYRTFTSGGDNADDAIRGRPFVSDQFVLVPTADKLYRMSLKQFKFQSVYPAQGRWDEQESAGNVIATPDNLIIAGPNRVTAYADLIVATAKLDEQLRATPNDVELYLRYAGLLFAAGKPDDGVAKLDLAIEKLGGRDALQRGAPRDHLFDIAVGFAVKLQKVDGTSPTLVPQLFERAQLAADSAEQQVRVRFAIAAMDRRTGDVAGEIALDQQILANAEWRRVPVNGVDGAYTAAAQAEASISQLMKDNGDAIYASYEAAAAKRLTEAKSAGTPDPKTLLAIADEYPVSKQTLEALSIAADQYEANHDPRQATRTLRRLLHSGLSDERKLITLQSLARNYLAVPRQIDTAIVRLKQASIIRLDAKIDRPLTLPDGRVISDQTIGQALALVSSYHQRMAQSQLPTFGVPTTSDSNDAVKTALQPAKEILSAAMLVDQPDDLARSDRVVAWGTDGQIHAFDARTAKQIIGSAKCAQGPIGCAYVGETLVVITPGNAIAIDANDKVLWDVPLATLPAIEAAAGEDDQPADDNKDGINAAAQVQIVTINGRRMRIFQGPNGIVRRELVGADNGTAPSGPEKITNFRLLSDRVLIGTTAGRIASIGLNDGKIDWQARPQDRPIRHFLSNEDFLAVSYGDTDGSSTVHIIDALSGSLVSREVYDATQMNQQLTNLALSPDGVLVAMTPMQLVARDLYEPSVAPWRKTAGNQNEQPFGRSTGSEQLVITADRVLAVYFSNGNLQSVRAYDLRTLLPARIHDEAHNRDIEASYSPVNGGERAVPNAFNGQAEQIPVSIEAAGPAFYLVGAQSLAAFNLDRKDWHWDASGEHGPTRDFAICQDFVVQINQVANATPNADRVQVVQMSIYNRELTPTGVESGILEQRPIIRDTASLLPGQWQVADGSFYYLSGGHKLKFMKANQ